MFLLLFLLLFYLISVGEFAVTHTRLCQWSLRCCYVGIILILLSSHTWLFPSEHTLPELSPWSV